MEKRIKLMIAEDRELMRKALISHLEEDRRIKVTAEAENGKKLLEQLARNRHDLPDIVLMDLEMPVMDGKECLGLICKKYPSVRVIMLSVYDSEPVMLDLITNGASAYLSKGCDSQTLFDAIHTVHREGTYFDRNLSKAMFRGLMKQKTQATLPEEQPLSKRETEILHELCKGKTNREVGETLNISASTVDFHRGNIYRKTKSKNIAQLITYAIKHRLMDEV